MRANDGKGKRYWQNWDNKDVANRIDSYWVQGEENWRNLLTSDLAACLGTGVKITEIGCGSGLICAKLLQLNVVDKASYMGGDISNEMIRLAKERLPDVKFYSWDIFNLDLETRSQANVICIQVLQHLPHYKSALQELVRISKQNLYIASWFHPSGDDQIVFSDPAKEWDGQQFYNNCYSLPKFLTALINTANNEGKVIKDIRVHNFKFYQNYSIHVSFE